MVARSECIDLRSDVDIVVARRAVGERATELGLTDLDRAKMVTAASELARNTVIHGKGGILSLEILRDDDREGLRLSFADHGPGIPDIDRALEDGYSTGGSLGLGLPGARRLVDDFSVMSTVGIGTCVTIVYWKR